MECGIGAKSIQRSFLTLVKLSFQIIAAGKADGCGIGLAELPGHGRCRGTQIGWSRENAMPRIPRVTREVGPILC